MTPPRLAGARPRWCLALAGLVLLAACVGNGPSNDGPPVTDPPDSGSTVDGAGTPEAANLTASPDTVEVEGARADSAPSGTVPLPRDSLPAGDTLLPVPGHLRQPMFGVAVQATRGIPLLPASVDFIRRHRPLLRTAILWSDVETKYGEYGIPKKYDPVRALAREAGTKLSVILAYNHELFACAGGRFRRGVCIQGVASEENRDAFLRYVAFLVREMGSEVGLWEIWNEPNAGNFWRPEPNVEDYIALASATVDTIRAIDSTAVVVSAGTAAVDFSFVGDLIEAGLHRKVDAIGIHMNMFRPGSARVREHGEREERPLNEVMSRLENLHAQTGVRFAVTEFGFPLYSPSYRDDPLLANVSGALGSEQQDQLGRVFARVSASPAIHTILIFQLQDSRNRRNPLGATRGLVDGEGNSKPGMTSLATALADSVP